MRNLIRIIFLFLVLQYTAVQKNAGQSLSTRMDELTAPEFIRAVDRAKGVCLLPVGIIEKHAAHLPLSTDLIASRHIAGQAAEKEYCVVFPPYYFGQINEGRHQPGTISYSPEILWKLLQETCDELSRNGLKKIIIVTGHGGNNDFLRYFCMSQLHSPKDYVVMIFQPRTDRATQQAIAKLKKTQGGGHADENETSMIQAIRPDLVKSGMAAKQSGADQARFKDIPNQYTGTWWYAQYPNHYAGDGSKSSAELGNLIIGSEVEQLVSLIKTVKQTNTIEKVQQELFNDSENPLNTKQ